MTKFKKEYLPYVGLAVLALAMIFCCFQACKKVDEISITSKEAIIAEYQKQMLKEKHDTLTIREYIYVDRWHDAKEKTKEVIKEVYRDAPDTCKGYVAKIELAVQGEQKAAQMVRETDSLIIANLDAVVKTDSILIAKAKQDLKLTQDTLSKNRKRQPIRNFVAICKGVIGGAVVVELINKLK